MVELPEIIEFIKCQTGCDKVSEDSDITVDLGVDGDDFDDLVGSFAKKFNVNVSSCLWYFHCAEEGSWNSIGGAFFRSPDKRVKHIAVTPMMLFEFAQKGKWDLPYPEHELPKRRYDILVNRILVIAFIVFVIYKCASN